MGPFLGVPVLARDEVLGNLYLTNEFGGDEFTETDQLMVERFAVHVAVAIQNARLYEETQRRAAQEQITILFGLLGDATVVLLGDVVGAGTTSVPFTTTLTLTLDEISGSTFTITNYCNQIFFNFLSLINLNKC